MEGTVGPLSLIEGGNAGHALVLIEHAVKVVVVVGNRWQAVNGEGQEGNRMSGAGKQVAGNGTRPAK
eukprot:1144125-Pelagomonas_calceolata.AAC.10